MFPDISNTCFVLWDLSRAECASWVQAWGSIFAIVVSVLAVNRSHNLQVRQRHQEANEAYTGFLEVVLQLLGAARQVTNKIYDLEVKGNVTPGEYAMMKIELATLDDAMGRIPVDRADRHELFEAWMVGQMRVRSLLGGVDYITSPGVSKMLEQHYVRNLANEARHDLDDRLQRLSAAIDARKREDAE